MTTKEQKQNPEEERMKKQQQQKGGGGGGGGPAPFLLKTHQMVEDRGTDEVISWTEDGAAFVVWKPDDLARDILPNHFKHNNFSSFVRQLNTYGFRKVVPERWEFANDHFRRGEQRLLSEIHRRKAPTSAPHTNPTGKSPEEDQSSTSTTFSTPPDDHHDQQCQQKHHLLLTEENERLKNDNKALASELAHVRKQYEALLGYLSMYVDVNKLVGNRNNSSSSFAVKTDTAGEVAAGRKQEEGAAGGGGGEQGVKLFGVCLRQKRVRGCDEGGRPTKLMGLAAPSWTEISGPPVPGTN